MPRNLTSSAHFAAAGQLAESISFVGCCDALERLVANGLPLEVLLGLGVATVRMGV